MPIRFVPDHEPEETLEGVDRHFYEKQVPPSGPFQDNSFKLAAARAKDKARHDLIKAVRQKAIDANYNMGRIEEAGHFLSGESITWKRSIDGVEGAPDDAIKL